MLALISFIVATVVFVLILFDVDIELTWGFLFIAAGLALAHLPADLTTSWRRGP